MSKQKQNDIFNALSNRPQTPNEIAKTLEINQKTVQSILLELVNTNNEVQWKKIGRYRVFWKIQSNTAISSNGNTTRTTENLSKTKKEERMEKNA